ncbi:putative membrane protein 45 [Achromobacter xylosoxidans A8]|uniref:Putative membrane protein 45 n=1 Tax=Achromobacter xylosoxidans (strain A8) TaxID=762376 RepID=E3HNQ4_ACHXA|nr:hypothetical protein [Achromobacter xylosoxidans]ADP17093.1 putative membrane protein 45 [Achromobacter xylosoxidans A8]
MDTFLSIFGIVVSFGLFLIGYRQTIGAKKERIAACNVEVEKIIFRRLILEGYVPNRLDIERLIDGKARDFRVQPDDLLSVLQTLNTLYTRIVESDLVPPDERRKMVDRITPALLESEAKPVEAVAAEEVEIKHAQIERMRAVTLMAVLASIVGAIVAALPSIANLDTERPELLWPAILTAIASLAMIALFLTAYRIRAAQEEPTTKSQGIEQSIRFERNVASTLKKSGANLQVLSSEVVAGDFLVERDGRKFLIEVKSWTRRVPIPVLAQLAERLRAAASSLGADECIVVTKAPIISADENIDLPGVTFLTEGQLAVYLKRPSGLSKVE